MLLLLSLPVISDSLPPHGLTVLHCLPEFDQVHVHCVGDAVQPAHPPMPTSSTLNLSQHQGLIQWVVCSYQMTKILELQLQHQSFQWIVQLSHPYMTTGKTIALTIWTSVGRVMSLLFNTLSRFVVTLLPRSNRLMISCLQSLSAVIFEPKKRKSVTTSTFSLSIFMQ